MKSLSKTLFAIYLLMLLWLVLFKFSYELSSVLNIQIRSLNLIPFADPEQKDLGLHLGEMIFNFIVFIPFGLLLSVNLKQTSFWRKLSFVFIFSLATEVTQYVLAIGRTDITDIITNTFGGFLGLILYDFGKKYIKNEILDKFIVVTGIILLAVFLYLRIMVLKVRY
jgi:glycopeptide antibiotics resistance protein